MANLQNFLKSGVRAIWAAELWKQEWAQGCCLWIDHLIPVLGLETWFRIHRRKNNKCGCMLAQNCLQQHPQNMDAIVDIAVK